MDNWLSEAFRCYYDQELPPPYIYPAPEGGVRFEWALGYFEISLDITLAAHKAYWHSLDLGTGLDEEWNLDLDREADWLWLNARLRHIVLYSSSTGVRISS